MTDPVTRRLQELHDHYVHAVNTAVAAGRDGLAAEISQAYPDHALRLLTGNAPSAVLAPRRSRPRPLPPRYLRAIEGRLRGPRRRHS